ncbi:MAG: ATP-binding cassette domain-containing protein, partial [Thermodesulfovibrionales bacterium]
ALRFIGLFDRRNDLVRRFSGGMKRRLEVARALVHRPELLILDEPTLGLDPQSREHLWSYIRGLPTEYGITVFMTTHYMDEAEVCDRIGIIDNGKIISSGSPEELKRLVGGDVVYVKARDIRRARAEVSAYMGVDVDASGDEIFFAVRDAESEIPKVIRLLGGDALSVRLQRPTLNDVFLRLTGRSIRETSADSAENMKEDVRAHRRRFDR